MDLFDRLKDLREQGLEEIKEAADEKSLNASSWSARRAN